MTTATERPNATGISAERAVRLYRRMLAIRLFEERVNDLYTRALGWEKKDFAVVFEVLARMSGVAK